MQPVNEYVRLSWWKWLGHVFRKERRILRVTPRLREEEEEELARDLPREKRDLCLQELIETENNYVEALEMLTNKFLRPLRELIEESQIVKIFSKIPELAKIHRILHQGLKKAQNNPHAYSVSQVFLDNQEKLLVYGEYCANLTSAQQELEDTMKNNDAARQKIQECQKEVSKGRHQLREYLVVPLQRILKYHLLLRELIRYTSANHPDLENLKKAHEAMMDLADYINEVKRDNEMLQIIEDIQTSIMDIPEELRRREELGKLRLDGEIKIECHPEPNKKRLKDGKQLMESDHIKFTKESDTVFVFKIDSMQMDDCCTYTVVASNPMGQVSEFFTIATDAAPQITAASTQRSRSDTPTTSPLKSAVLAAQAHGQVDHLLRRYKNGKEIMADDRFKMVVDESFYILKIRRLERKDKGTYCCELSNSSGTAKSEGVLSVRAPQTSSRRSKMRVPRRAGKTSRCSSSGKPTRCQLSNGSSMTNPFATTPPVTPSVDRTQHGAHHPRGDGGRRGHVLCHGLFSPAATNEYGESVCKARFRLHEAPVVTEGLKDAEFLEDNSAKFTFKATGVPTPEIKWTKDGKKWSPDMHRVKLKQEGDDTFTLYFDEAKTEDSGHYVATISNVEGTVSTEASIVVNSKCRRGGVAAGDVYAVEAGGAPADGRSSIAVAKCSKGAANDSGIHEQTVVDGGSLGEGKGLTGSASEASEGGSEKETTETKIEDDQEKTVSKSVDMTVYDEIMQVEAEDSDESEENSTLIVRGFLEGTSSSEVPRGGCGFWPLAASIVKRTSRKLLSPVGLEAAWIHAVVRREWVH
ncbi:Guanine nucleotide exchange factor VAV2 [Penaeus vannamei]|uniref:Guanine nucleotide exchange factor VAV2 n=1 Tax=Penaeus vannamei TaxID=6689 RepID=A0A423U0B6_PENVA|nr:Guanine nucleotide exchange factor VAV2 [Penaeus vannamei]